MNGLAAQYALFVAEAATAVLAVIGLVDALATRDEIIRSACQRGRVLHVSFQRKLGLPERLRHSAQSAWDGI